MVVEGLRTERADQPVAERLDVLADRGILDQRQLGARLEQEVRAHLALAAFTRGEDALGSGERDDQERREERPAASHGWRRATSRAK